MRRTYLDSGVLIARIRGSGQAKQRVHTILTDSSRHFVSSEFVRLEVLPIALFFNRRREERFYRAFFQRVAAWAIIDSTLLQDALQEAAQWGLGGMDALHVAAAVQVGADELVTTERLTQPLHQVQRVKVVHLPV